MMSGTVLSLILMLSPVQAGPGQSISPEMSVLLERLKTSRVSFDYSYTVGDATPVVYSGTALLQQGAYYGVCGDVRIYCDGTTRWTVDKAAKEVYIEKASRADDFLSNADEYLAGAYDLSFTDNSFKGSYADSDSGAPQAHFVVTEIIFFENSKDLTPFVFDPEKLDGSWVVTDMRQQ